MRPTHGRLIYFGACNPGDGLVAFTASRVAVEGCVDALRSELQNYGIHVIALDSRGVIAESMFKAPIPFSKFNSFLFNWKIYFFFFSIIKDFFVFFHANLNFFPALSGDANAPTQYSADVLTRSALEVIENALWEPRPSSRYHLSVPNSKLYALKMSCRNSFRSARKFNPTTIQV